MLEFSSFAPDADEYNPSIITACDNLIPVQKGYKAAPSLIDNGWDAVAAAVIGAARIIKLDGTARLFAGTRTHLYEEGSGSWTDRSGATYTALATDRWRFAQYGNVTLAVNNADKIQASTSGAFADVDAGAPVAKHIISLKNFVIVANTDTSTDQWHCSALNDQTDWTEAVSTQCTSGRLVDIPGEITALKDLGDYAIAYKESGMYIGRYVGPPIVWGWDIVSTEIGTIASDSVVNIGTAHFFVGKDNFYYFDGSRPLPIGNLVKDWFFDDAHGSYLYNIIGLHDRDNSSIYWFYTSSGSSGALDSCIVYNYRTQQWGLASYDVEVAIETLSGGLTYDALGTSVSTYADFPDITYNSSFFTTDVRVLGVFNASHKLDTLTGTGLNSSLTTSIFGDDENFTLLQRVRPRFIQSPTTGTMINYFDNETGESLTEDATTTLTNGKFDVLRSARWHQLKFNFTGDVTIKGLKTEGVPVGDE